MAFDNWLTCPTWIELARTCMGNIDFDPASNMVAQDYVKASTFCISPDDAQDIILPTNCLVNGITAGWHGNVWLNPPYSRDNIDAFVTKAMDEWYDYSYIWTGTDYKVNQMLILVNSSTDSEWYHTLMQCCDAALLVRGRIKFWKIMNGKAYEKWEGEKSKLEGKNKIGNSPRYLSTLFYFGDNKDQFQEVYQEKGTIVCRL